MTAKEFRGKENWNKSDFFKGEYDIDLKSIDEYAEKYHQAKLKLLGIANFVGQSEQLKNAEQKAYAKGWQEGSEYGYSAAHDGR